VSHPTRLKLPPRLDDPLAMGRGFAWAYLILCLSMFLASLAPFVPWPKVTALHWVKLADFAPLLVSILIEILSNVKLADVGQILIGIWLVRNLPGHRTNAFYLRSFRGDDRTARLRLAILRGLGPSFRLSGIRAPGRRIASFWKYAFFLFYCLNYTTTRYMNLEAGDDWFARLWRSLGDARCAFIDLTDLTEHVTREVELVYRTLGTDRVLFLGDQSRTSSEWRDLVAEQLKLEPEEAAELQVMTWNPRDWRLKGVTADIAEFARIIPPGRAGLNYETYPLVAPTVGLGRGVGSALGDFILAVTGFLFVPLVIQGVATRAVRGPELTWFGIGISIMPILLFGYLVYLTAWYVHNSGQWIATFIKLSLWAGAIFLVFVVVRWWWHFGP
jgi:hypothetical protein